MPHTLRLVLIATCLMVAMLLSVTSAEQSGEVAPNNDVLNQAAPAPGVFGPGALFEAGLSRVPVAGPPLAPAGVGPAAVAVGDDCGPYFTMQAPHDSAAFGLYMYPVGDLNSDGFEDLWIAEGRWGISTGGLIYSGADHTLMHTVEGEGVSSRLIVAIGTDLDGDGYDDLIFADSYYDGIDTGYGRVYVTYGSEAGMPSVIEAASADVKLDGYIKQGYLGKTLVVLGDIDGDTHPDFAVGASEASIGGPGHVYVYSGSTLDTLYSVAGVGTGTGFGWDMVNAGDVNNDGYDDLLVGASRGTGAGYAQVISGFDGAVLYHLDGEAPNDRFSYYSLAGVGDLNLDGHEDVLVGAFANQAGGGQWAGRAYVFFGGSGPFPQTINAADADFIITGETRSCLGFGVGGVGDVNADGVPDFAVGAIFFTHPNLGQLRLYSGVDASPLFVLEGLESNEDFGGACLALGDQDGDGVKDLLVAAHHESEYRDGGAACGQVYAYLIGDTDQDGVMAQCDNCQRYATPGNDPVSTGDVNMDGPITSVDIIFLVNYIFKGGLAPLPIPEAGDVNHDGKVTSMDIIYLVYHVFKGGAAPLDACSLDPLL